MLVQELYLDYRIVSLYGDFTAGAEVCHFHAGCKFAFTWIVTGNEACV